MISTRLTAARTRLGWSREALAFHSGVSWSAIAQLESGRRTSPRSETLVALARALGVTVSYLVGDDSVGSLLMHEAVLYDSPDGFMESVVPFVSEGVERLEPVLVVTSSSNLRLVESHLGAWPAGVTTADSRKMYRSPLSAVTAIRAFQNDRTAEGAPWIRIVGEPPWTHPDLTLWATYESMFNLIFIAAPLTVMCPYDSRSVHETVIQVARQTHPSLVHGTEIEANADFVEPETYVLGRGQGIVRGL